MPGELEAIAKVQELGAFYGYGNLIQHLKDAWSAELQAEWNQARDSADIAAGHICVYCHTDFRTGKKVKP